MHLSGFIHVFDVLAKSVLNGPFKDNIKYSATKRIAKEGITIKQNDKINIYQQAEGFLRSINCISAPQCRT